MTGIIKENLYKTFITKVFPLCTVIVFFMCFASVVTYDMRLGEDVMVFHLLGDNALIKSDYRYSRAGIMLSVGGIGFEVFLPLVIGICACRGLMMDKEESVRRPFLSREGKNGFCAGKIVSALLCGGLVTVAGYLMFCVFAYVYFPGINHYARIFGSDTDMFREELLINYGEKFGSAVFEENVSAIVLSNVVSLFEYGAVLSCFSLLFAGLFKNKYVAVCVPFYLNYAFAQIDTLLMEKAVDSSDMKRYDFLYMLRPYFLLNHNNQDVHMHQKQLIMQLGIIAVLCLLFYLICRRRLEKDDC